MKIKLSMELNPNQEIMFRAIFKRCYSMEFNERSIESMAKTILEMGLESCFKKIVKREEP